MKPQLTKPDITNTGIAFSWRTSREILRARFLFSIFRYGRLVRFLMWLSKFLLALGLPVAWLIKPLVFRHFCSGISLPDSLITIRRLKTSNVFSIPDFSAEGKETDAAFDRVKEEVLKSIRIATNEPAILSAVFKPTGLAPFALWEKLSQKVVLTQEEQNQQSRLEHRLDEIFSLAYNQRVPVLVDAEETWIQPAIDHYIRKYSELYNLNGVIIYNTVQMYRTDRLEFIRRELERAIQKGYFLGYKIVRGAYHEKEQKRALVLGYPSPVFARKEETDEAYNAALTYCYEHHDRIAVCAATHNEKSALLFASLMAGNDSVEGQRLTFAQLFGMSDHLTFNLADAGYTAAKYLPYGPVKEVLPYLIRRAEENRTVTGEIGRELHFIRQEIARRRAQDK